MKWFKHQLVILFTFLMLLFSVQISGQNLSPQSQRSPQFEDLFNGLPIVTPNSHVSGDIYLNDKWKLGTITLTERKDTIKGFQIRYNVYFNEIEVNAQSGVRRLTSARVKRFSFEDSILRRSTEFVNSTQYLLDGVPLIGFFELLVNGQMPLLKRYTMTIKEPDYLPALTAGSRDIEIRKQTDYYIAIGNVLKAVKGKKKLLEAFGEKAATVKSYMKVNDLYPSTQDGLIRILEYYNTLL